MLCKTDVRFSYNDQVLKYLYCVLPFQVLCTIDKRAKQILSVPKMQCLLQSFLNVRSNTWNTNSSNIRACTRSTILGVFSTSLVVQSENILRNNQGKNIYKAFICFLSLVFIIFPLKQRTKKVFGFLSQCFLQDNYLIFVFLCFLFFYLVFLFRVGFYCQLAYLTVANYSPSWALSSGLQMVTQRSTHLMKDFYHHLVANRHRNSFSNVAGLEMHATTSSQIPIYPLGWRLTVS